MNVRALREADLPAVLQLLRDDEEYVNGAPSRLQLEDLNAWFARVDFERDTRLYERDGAPRALGWTDVVPGGGTVVGIGIVHPDVKGRGIGTAIVDWCEARTLAHGAKRLHQIVLANDTAGAQLLEARGFRDVRHFYEMAIQLDGPPPAPEIAVETFREEDARAFHDTLDEAFQDHWEHHGRSFEDWWSMHRASPNFDPSLWFVIRDGDEIAAATRNEANRNGGGFISSLGVRRPWRGKGYAKALLQHSFRVFWERGLPRVTLGVDAENPTGATHLYERVGMHVEQENVVYEKELA